MGMDFEMDFLSKSTFLWHSLYTTLISVQIIRAKYFQYVYEIRLHLKISGLLNLKTIFIDPV